MVILSMSNYHCWLQVMLITSMLITSYLRLKRRLKILHYFLPFPLDRGLQFEAQIDKSIPASLLHGLSLEWTVFSNWGYIQMCFWFYNKGISLVWPLIGRTLIWSCFVRGGRHSVSYTDLGVGLVQELCLGKGHTKTECAEFWHTIHFGKSVYSSKVHFGLVGLIMTFQRLAFETARGRIVPQIVIFGKTFFSIASV